jgi:hypothetical protein
MKKYNHPVEGEYTKKVRVGPKRGNESPRYIKSNYENEANNCGLPFDKDQCYDCVEYNKCKGDIK